MLLFAYLHQYGKPLQRELQIVYHFPVPELDLKIDSVKKSLTDLLVEKNDT